MGNPRSYPGHKIVHHNPVCPGTLHAVFKPEMIKDVADKLSQGYRPCKRCHQMPGPSTDL